MLFCPVAGIPKRHFRVTQTFGENPAYYAKYGMRGHNGYDFAPLKKGDRTVVIYAPHDGFAVFKEEEDGYGSHVIITSDLLPSGKLRESTLAHLAQSLITPGEFIYQGDAVGIMGNTGDSTGVHLHWTYRNRSPSGEVIDRNNGYKGAIPIGPFVRFWIPDSHL